MSTKASKRLKAAKYHEREAARKLLKIDGEPEGYFKQFITSTGRIGQYTELQSDIISKSYYAEAKAVLSNNKAKNPGINITEETIRKIINNRKRFKSLFPLLILRFAKLGFELHCIEPERHAELLEYERRCKNENHSKQ